MKKTFYVPYFPIALTIGSTVLGVILVAAFFNAILLTITLAILLICWTTLYITNIDLGKGKFIDFLRIGLIRFNYKKIKFNKLDRIVITKEKFAHSYRSRVLHKDVSWNEYTATILFTDGQCAELMAGNNLKEMLINLKPIAEFCKVGVENRTKEDYYWIDLTKVE